MVQTESKPALAAQEMNTRYDMPEHYYIGGGVARAGYKVVHCVDKGTNTVRESNSGNTAREVSGVSGHRSAANLELLLEHA